MAPRRWIQIAWLMFALLAIGILTQATRFNSDLTFFLPISSEPADRVMVAQMREGPLSRFLLMAVSGGTREQRLAASRALRHHLAQSPPLTAVTNGAHVEWLDQLTARLFRYRFVLNPPWPGSNPYSIESLREALLGALDRLGTPEGYLEERWLGTDPLGAWRDYLTSLMDRGSQLHTDDGLWVSPRGDAVLLLALTRGSGFDINAQAEAQQAVRATFESLPDHEVLTLTLGGPGVLSTETHALISREAGLISALTLLLVALLLLSTYRSVRIIALSMLPLVFGLVTGALATRMAFGSVHAVTAAFAGTLLGVAADYPNHFFSHIDGSQREAATMARIWPTLRLGILTNVIGFAAMLFSGFDGLKQLAVFASSGLIGAGLTTRYLLPTFPIDRPPIHATPSKRVRQLLENRLPPFARLIPIGLTLGLMCGVYLLQMPIFRDDLALLNPVSQERLEKDLQLQRAFGVPDLRYLLLVTGPTPEQALEAVEALEPSLRSLKLEGAIGDYELVSRWLPSQNAQRQRQESLPHRDVLEQRLRSALKDLPFKADAFNRFIEAAETARIAPPLMPSDFDGTPLEPRIRSLLMPIDEGHVVIIPLTDIRDLEKSSRTLNGIDPEHVFFVDMQSRATALLRAYRIEAMGFLAVGLILIAVALRVGLGRLAAMSQVLAPVMLAGLSTASLMVLVFKGLNLYHFVALLLVMGLSLDQALFFNQSSTQVEARFRTVIALIICSMSAIMAFGCLAFSSVGLLKAIGSTVASGAAFAIVYAALLANSTATSQ